MNERQIYPTQAERAETCPIGSTSVQACTECPKNGNLARIDNYVFTEIRI